MPYYYTILSPERVEIRYRLAGLGTRAIAAAIDDTIIALVAGLALVGIGLFLGIFESLAWDAPTQAILAFWTMGAFVAWFAYYIGFEIAWNGQTPGKRWMGLRVIRLDGSPIEPFNAFSRELLRLVDFFPPYYALGGTVAFFNSYWQRIGDLAAGTIVVREGHEVRTSKVSLWQLPPEPTPQETTVYSVSGISPQEYRALRDYLNRRSELNPEADVRLARLLWDDVKTKIVLHGSEQFSPALMIEAVVAKYERSIGDQR